MESMTFQELTNKMIALYHQERKEDALQLLEEHQAAFPEQAARLTFWRMCFLSLLGRPDDVLSVFRQGLDNGLWWHAELFADPDLNAVRDLPEFQKLVAVAQEKYNEAQSQVERDFALLVPEPPASGRYPLLITLHGRNGNKDVDLQHWEVARQRGWLVLSCQSTQPVFQGAYHWDNAERGVADVLHYYEQASQTHPVDPERIVIAGFSQGGGMAIHTALGGRIPIRGFLAIASWWQDPKALVPQTADARNLRGYFIVGEKDHTLETAREIQKILKENNLPFDEEVHADLGHEFSPDFETSFDKAIRFIFKENE